MKIDPISSFSYDKIAFGMKPLISIIVPCWNTASHLEKCLESLVDQTYSPKEIIVVDDGSDDHPEEVVKKFPGIIFLKHDKNISQNAAKATAMQWVKGKYVFFADADDVFYPTCLEKLIIPLESSRKYSYSYCNFNFYKVGSHIQRTKKTGKFDLKKLKVKNYINGCSLYRRSDMPTLDATVLRYSDWDYFLTLAEKKHFGIWVDSELFESHLRPESISSRGDYDREFWRLKIQDKHGLGPKVAVLTFTWNRLDYTKKTLDKLPLLGYNFDHFIWDNGSTDKTPLWLEKYQKHSTFVTKVFKSPKNIGIAAAKSKLLRAVGQKYDYILKLDNDCEIISKNILRELIILSRVFQDNVMLSPKVEGLNHPVPRHAFFRVGPHVLSPVPMVGGIFSFSHAKYYQSFNGNKIFKHKYDDAEFAGHVWKNGGKIYYVDDLLVFHMESTNGQLLRYPEYFKIKNEEIQQEKEIIKRTKTPVDFGIKNADYWWEVYRIDKGPRFLITSILYRSNLIKPYRLLISAILLIKKRLKRI